MLQNSCIRSRYSAVKLIYNISKYLGLVEFTWSQGIPVFKRSTVAVTRIVVQFVIIVALVFMNFNRFETEVSSVSEIMIAVSKPISHAIVVIICFCHQSNIRGIIQKLVHFNHLLASKKEFFNIKLTVIVVQLLLGIAVIIFSNTFEWFYKERCLIYIPNYALYIFIDLSIYVVELQFINFVLQLKQYFAGINTKLGDSRLKAGSIMEPPNLKTLEYLHLFYDALCDVAESLNSVYSPVVLLDIGISFFRSTQKLHRIILSNLGKDPGILYPHTLVYRSFHWIKFIFIISACSSCVKSVSDTYNIICFV
jgi:hypothetical protein